MKARLLFLQSTKGGKNYLFLSFILDLNVFFPSHQNLISLFKFVHQKHQIRKIK